MSRAGRAGAIGHPRAVPDPGPPDLVIEGRIATLVGPAGFGWTDAIAIRDGRVVAAGDAPTITGLAGPRTVRWRLGPHRVVIPGIVDAHLHLGSAAMAARHLDLGHALGRDAVLAAIRAAHERMSAAGDRDGWLLGHGWSLDRMGGWPAAGDLDAAARGRPVALWSHDHHSRWVSTRALGLAGVGERTPDPVGGRIGRDATGQPDGVLLENAATLVDRAVPAADADTLAAAVTAYAAVLARSGVVGVHDPGEMVDDPELRRGPTLYRALARDGGLPLRVAACVREAQLDAAIAAGIRTGRGAGPDGPAGGDPRSARLVARYRDGWLKLFADGALGSRSAALLAPYERDDRAGPAAGGETGMLLHTRDSLLAVSQRAAAAGIAVQIHGIGDAAVRLALDVLARIPSLAPVRHRVEHAQLVDPADQPRFADLGIVASVQPCHLIGDATAAEAAWGARTDRCFPLRDLDATGALLAFGTDAPVEPPDPWPGIAAAVTRASGSWGAGRDPFHPEQALTLSRALRAACRGGPASLGIDDEGHLGRGAKADLLVIPAASLDDPPRPGGALETCRPLATLIEGDVAWQDPAFDP